MDYLGKAIKIAAYGAGFVSPNPMVGAVIVKNNKIIATGYHHRFGGDHAEIVALKKAGSKARGATLYVSLEPCGHFGKTPPCTQAIIDAGIQQVHLAILDPNPLVAGKGKRQLQQAGIKVFAHNDDRARELNEVFFKFITTKRPFVALKWAMSLDGKIATRAGNSKWISNEQSRKIVHKLRQSYDGVLVGVNTIIKDNPRLTARGINRPSHPVRIILDSLGKTPLTAKIFRVPGRVIIASTKKLSLKKELAYIKRGATVIKTNSRGGQVNLKELLKKLGNLGIASILVEGGSETLASFTKQKLFGKAYIFIAPKIIGGRAAKTAVGGIGASTVASASQLRIKTARAVGNDIFLAAYSL